MMRVLIPGKHFHPVLAGPPTFVQKKGSRSTYTKHISFKGGMNVETVDYDKALYYTHRSQWDNLLILMVRTKDDLLSKRIEQFLHAYNFENNYAEVEKKLYSLLRYIDHAVETGHEHEEAEYAYLT